MKSEEKYHMDKVRHYLSQRAVRAGVAVTASALLVAGATWRGFAADTTGLSPQTNTVQTTPVATPHVLAGGRDSYADVVKMVAPGVVTVRVEGRAKAAPTGFGDDPE